MTPSNGPTRPSIGPRRRDATASPSVRARAHLGSCGGIRRTGPHTFLMANYTSPLDEPDISWIEGQTNPRGTQLYFLTITFVPE